MKIDGTPPFVPSQEAQKKPATPSLVDKGAELKNDTVARQDEAASYVREDVSPNKAGYDKPVAKPDVETIAHLKAESDRIYSHLKEMVRQLLERQGLSFQEWMSGEGDTVPVEVDEATRAEAAAMVGEGGDLSAEAVSDRIVAFAKALSGEDKSKLDLLRGAIEEGFSQAKEALGGTLPDISQKTWDLIQEKLDAWEAE